jgi:general secretion pathway protein A
MDYFSILHLDKEPFSNSPDPSFFFKSRQHQDCLQKVELALRLKRGLNVVMGDVGTGKTTICRQLIRRFQEDDQIETHLILDPAFDTPVAFLRTVTDLLAQEISDAVTDTWELKEIIKKSLYRKGVDKGRTVILIFDEGQKLPGFVIELLREFLNYETNTHKLLQIAIFAQCEFEAVLIEHANFADRVNLLHRLEPLSFRDTRELIRYRLRQSSTNPKPLPLFTIPAMWAIYRSTKGYPRRVINLCHQSLLAMIIQNRTKASLGLVRSCVQRAIGHPDRHHWRPLTSLLSVLLLLVAIGALLPEPYSPISHLASGLQRRPWFSVHPVRSPGKTPSRTAAADEEMVPPLTPAPTQGPPMVEPEAASVPAAGLPLADAPYMQAPEAVVPPDSILPEAVPSADSVTRPPATSPVAAPRKDQGQNVIMRSKSPPEGPPPAGGRPLLLGRLRVSDGDTLVQLVRRVRGNYDPKYMASLLALNPQIKDPDDIAVGDEIIFPAQPVRISPLIHQTHWLQLDERQQLNRACEILIKYRDLGLKTRLVPYWSTMEGLRFVVLAAEAHPSLEAAHLQMTALPADLMVNGRIRSQWGQDPVFFASPF